MTPDARLAADIAQRAGSLLLRVREEGSAGIELGRIGDAKANELIVRSLAEHRPGDSVLSEESTDDDARVSADRVWIVDPLDGSREYGTPGRTDWAVHIALWEKGTGLTACAVAQPSFDAVYSTDDVLATFSPLREHPRIVVSGSRPPYFIEPLAESFDAVMESMGSAGAKAMAVVRGDADAYVHTGGQWEWDSAAPVGVALAAGLHCSRINGDPLLYNQFYPYLPDLLICRTELATPLLDGIARFADRPVDSDRVALVREFVMALVSRDASHVRLAEGCTYTLDNNVIARTADEVQFAVEHGSTSSADRSSAIAAVEDVSFTETLDAVIADYRTVMTPPQERTASRTTFVISGSVIGSIVVNTSVR